MKFVKGRALKHSRRELDGTEPERIRPRHQAFADEWSISGNGTAAYMKVYGIKDKDVASSCASRLLRTAKVQRYLTRVRLRRSVDTDMSRDRLISTLIAMATADQRKIASWDRKRGVRIGNSDDLDDLTALAVEGVKSVTRWEGGKRVHDIEVKLAKKAPLLDMLSRLLGFDQVALDDDAEDAKIARLKALMREMDHTIPGAKKKK